MRPSHLDHPGSHDAVAATPRPASPALFHTFATTDQLRRPRLPGRRALSSSPACLPACPPVLAQPVRPEEVLGTSYGCAPSRVSPVQGEGVCRVLEVRRVSHRGHLADCTEDGR